MADSDSTPTPKRSPEEVARLQAIADGAFGAAGHSVDDPESREILRQHLAGEITSDEARKRLLATEGL